MILSFGPAGGTGSGLLALGAVVAYGVAALPGMASARRLPAALILGLLLHAVLLTMDVSGIGRDILGARLGFGPVLSLTVWLVLLVHVIESRLTPLPAIRRALACLGVAAVLLAWFFPGEPHALAQTPLAALHWVLGVGSYGLFGAAVLHAAMLDSAEKRLRLRAGNPQIALGMPLLQLERLTFRFVEAGFIVLSVALVLGVATTTHWRWTHKAVFSILGWAVFAALLAGRKLKGWRGRRATRGLYLGTALLLLAYAGSRFVMEVLLGRPVG